MSVFDFNKDITQRIEALPADIKNKVKLNGGGVKSSEELHELVRRIKSAETGKIF